MRPGCRRATTGHCAGGPPTAAESASRCWRPSTRDLGYHPAPFAHVPAGSLHRVTTPPRYRPSLPAPLDLIHRHRPRRSSPTGSTADRIPPAISRKQFASRPARSGSPHLRCAAASILPYPDRAPLRPPTCPQRDSRSVRSAIHIPFVRSQTGDRRSLCPRSTIRSPRRESPGTAPAEHPPTIRTPSSNPLQ